MSSADDVNETQQSDDPIATDAPSQESLSGEIRSATDGNAGSETSSEPAGPPEESTGEAAVTTEQTGDAERQLAERTADLQRLSAEYANYRRRAERDRKVATDNAKASVVTELLGVLDDLDRARTHGDLESGPLKSVADKLSDVLRKQGLTEFGVAGEPFDPTVHEAVQHSGSGADPVVDIVMRKGYRFGERVLRHALVGVCDGVSDLPEATPEPKSEAAPQAEDGEQ